MRRITTRNKLAVIKTCLYLIDLFYWITGVVLMCIGISAQTKLRDTFVVINEASSGVPVIITFVGVIVVSISSFGAIALMKSNHAMIKVVNCMLLIIILIEIVVGISAYAYREKLHRNLLGSVLKTLDEYDRESQITRGVDDLQRNFQCCGAQNYTDWLNTTYGYLNSAVPSSCCKAVTRNCGRNLSKDASNINQQGCVEKLKKWTEDHIVFIGAVGISIGFAQILGVFLCYVLLRVLKEDYANL
ncbi:PREDICTED: tetraspanin-7-like isoform X2 [Gavialis gangeticus]|uniref:tetraspanin-7-like isoform X2 n=1 Tax=Gavialis gangeticus TaxID=94835 RepID=UPI00092E8028|nr:PREDICTED: tetraspanin-7-like isoform X2 [Gavialis gangeticus]